MKFEIGDETDKKLVNVLFHEFVMCEKAFDKFVHFAGSNIMGNTDYRRNAIEKSYAPEWENHISYYQEAVSTDFGKDFRDIRNNASHTDYRRAGGNRIGLMDFYKKYHEFVYLLYYSTLLAWSGKTHQDHKIKYVEEFDFSASGN